MYSLRLHPTILNIAYYTVSRKLECLYKQIELPRHFSTRPTVSIKQYIDLCQFLSIHTRIAYENIFMFERQINGFSKLATIIFSWQTLDLNGL